MHPALSILLFSTLSGTGYGVLFWLGVQALVAPAPTSRALLVAQFGLALLLVSIGLLMSLGHLGKPLRAWRAFSQWRSSWLSREGVMAVITYLPALALFVLLAREHVGMGTRTVGALLALCALATVACTAMIYASLPPIAAWRHRLVVPGYLGFALLGGAWVSGGLRALLPVPPGALPWAAGTVLLLSVGVLLLKLRYWRDTDAAPFASTAERATGLGAFGRVKSFEAPNTETSYLQREMGFVVARKHAARLRQGMIVLGFVLPPLLLAAALAWPQAAAPALGVAALSFQLGAFVERWLFFAQARHTVALYYCAGESDPG